MSFYIAVDIGGTQMRAACYRPSGLEPFSLERITTRPSAGAPQPVDPFERLQTLINSIWPVDETVTAISVAAPGPTNPYSGVILKAPNIHEWVDLPLSQKLHERFRAPVVVGNDANLAALAEWKYGAGRGHDHMIYMTISTGIGSGIIVDGRMLLGDQGLAAEVGHVTVLPDGPMCGCGQRGHLEALASGTAIARWVEDELVQGASSTLVMGQQPITAKMVSEAAHQGDELCIAALARAGHYIGMALANLLHIFNPSALILGGGVSQSGSLLFEPIKAALQEHAMNPHYLDNLTLEKAHFGDEVGLVGALALGRTLYPVPDSIPT
ncbi:MAG: ROK family protein [Chloroflexota bacterium]